MENTLPGSIQLRGQGLAQGLNSGSLAIIGLKFTTRRNSSAVRSIATSKKKLQVPGLIQSSAYLSIIIFVEFRVL